MNNPIVIGVDPVHEDREPLAFATALAELTGAPLIAVAAYPPTRSRAGSTLRSTTA